MGANPHCLRDLLFFQCIPPQDKTPALPGMAGLGLAGSCPTASAPWLLGHVCSSPPPRTVCSGKGKAHGGAWVIYRRGKDGKREHKHMVCIGNGARAAP